MSGMTSIERRALELRHHAAMKMLRDDPTFTGARALGYVVCPPLAVLEASLDRAALDLGVAECGRCRGPVDDDGYCSMCGAVSAVYAGRVAVAA